MNILKDLYHGDIAPVASAACTTPKYKKLTKQIQEAETKLFCGLSEEKQLQYDTCVSLIFEREGVIDEDLFVKAFRLGAQTMLEILNNSQ